MSRAAENATSAEYVSFRLSFATKSKVLQFEQIGAINSPAIFSIKGPWESQKIAIESVKVKAPGSDFFGAYLDDVCGGGVGGGGGGGGVKADVNFYW